MPLSAINVVLQLGNPCHVLKEFGVPDLPIHLTQRVISKAVNKKHDVDAADLKDIALNIQAPLAVFASRKGDGHLVLVTEARHQDGNVVVAMELEVSRDGIAINDISSVHPKRDGSIGHWIDDGLLRGYEKGKGRTWLENSAGSNYPQPQVKAALDKASVYQTNSISQ
jgi:hypothetical protein